MNKPDGKIRWNRGPMNPWICELVHLSPKSKEHREKHMCWNRSKARRLPSSSFNASSFQQFQNQVPRTRDEQSAKKLPTTSNQSGHQDPKTNSNGTFLRVYLLHSQISVAYQPRGSLSYVMICGLNGVFGLFGWYEFYKLYWLYGVFWQVWSI